MALYDCINGNQVQCFKNSLVDYKHGDGVPLKTKTYSYEENIIIIDTLNPAIKPFQKKIHLIKNSKVEGSYDIGDFKAEYCEDVLGYYTDTGKKLNVSSYEDIVKFLYDEYKLQLDIDFLNVANYDNKKIYSTIETLETEFYCKWYKQG